MSGAPGVLRVRNGAGSGRRGPGRRSAAQQCDKPGTDAWEATNLHLVAARPGGRPRSRARKPAAATGGEDFPDRSEAWLGHLILGSLRRVRTEPVFEPVLDG